MFSDLEQTLRYAMMSAMLSCALLKKKCPLNDKLFFKENRQVESQYIFFLGQQKYNRRLLLFVDYYETCFLFGFATLSPANGSPKN